MGWAGVECSVDLAQEELGRELFKMMFASSAGGIMWFFYIYIRNLNLILRMMGSPEQVLNNRVT